jgi:hypothetical protein
VLKTLAAIVAAAIVATAITIISAPIADVVASPLPEPVAEAITTCKQRPWPYLNCVGTEFGNPSQSTGRLLNSRLTCPPLRR